jgi:predicted adenylyl cyclase CyaB
MPRNVEIKARLLDLDRVTGIASQLADSTPELITQEDVFFPCQTGRLKLRIFSPAHAELIYYRRPNQEGPKTSQYQITPTTDPAGLRAALTAAYGVRAVVNKVRTLLLVGRTRIHLDRVDSLGDFLELEVVLGNDESIAAGEVEARALMATLGIAPDDLISDAYVDLLERQEPN